MLWILAKALVLVKVATLELDGDHHKHHKLTKHHAKATHEASDSEADEVQNTTKKNVMSLKHVAKKHKVKKAKTNASKVDASKCWGYENVKHWETVFPGCKLEDQSPIALATECKGNEVGCTPSSQPLGNHIVSSPVAGAYLSNNGNFLELVAPAYFSTVKLGKLVWKSARLQFHTPSEHTMNGIRYPAEMQIVYRPTEQDNKWTLVTSVLLKEGYNKNPFLSSIGLDMLNLPREEGDKMYVSGSVDLTNGLKVPLEGGFAGYEGTLTSPPCTKDVLWFVAENPLEASATQIANLQRRFPKGNNRPLHPIGSRMVYRDFHQWSSAWWSTISLSTVLFAIANLQ